MKKVDIKHEVDKVVEKVSDGVNDQLKQAQAVKKDIVTSIKHKQVEQKKLNRKVGRHIKNGFEEVQHDVDQTVKKISKTMDKASNKK